MLAYYATSPGREFWTEHWGRHGVEELLAIARRSPLTTLLTRALPRAGLVLEAGCGLGQYVVLLREHGWRVVGADWSVEALAACRRVAPAPLAAMALDALALRDGALAAYVSLGVVEHDRRGPDAILAEARRVLATGGVLVVSVPYVNGLRRLASPWLRRRGRVLERRGGEFYQYAFTRGELRAAVMRHGFFPTSATPYDPARILRRALPPALVRRLSAPVDGVPAGRRDGAEEETGARGLARRLLYSEPALRLLGHMLLVVARKA
jgi:SAM-dependent methyltransferase